MLKIKDNVDLKELEKFGFVNNGEWFYTDDRTREILCIQENKYIYFELEEVGLYGALVEDLLYKLFDLIQAGLVEKVVE